MTHRELETVKMRSDEEPDDFLYKKDRCRDRLNSVTPKEGPSDRRYEDIILQCLPPEYDRVRQTHFEREDCNLADIRRMMSKIYADNLARSHSDSSRGIAGRGVAMRATGQNLSKINCYYCNKFGYYKNDCADFKAAHQQNGRRRQRKHKRRGGHQPDQPKAGGQHQQRGEGKMWFSYHKTTIHNGADCRAAPADGLNGSAHFAQVCPPSVPGICSSWDLLVRDYSDEKPCISFLVREVQPAAKPAKVRVEKKGTRPFGPVSTTATGGWRTRPWPFTPRAGQAISIGGPVAEKTFGMADDEEPVEKALMASSSVAVTSKYSTNSNLANLMVPAESLPCEVREPLSGGASTPSGVRASPEAARPSPAPVSVTARTGAAIRNNKIHRPNVVTLRAVAELTGAVTRYKGVRSNKSNNDDDDNINNNNLAALAERFQPSTLHKLRQLGIYTITVTPDDNDINNNHAALVERFQPSTLHKLRQLGFYAKKVTPDDNNIYNNNHAALAERFQPSTLHKLRQLDLYTNTDTLDDNINNNHHVALAERFQPSTLHKLRQLGRSTNTDTPDTAHQLDAEAVPPEVAYTRSNTQPSCSGVG